MTSKPTVEDLRETMKALDYKLIWWEITPEEHAKRCQQALQEWRSAQETEREKR
jgi:GTP cyclohydrolase III